MSERMLFLMIGVIAILAAVVGVLLAAYVFENADHGGRGGAVAVAIALVTLFATRNYANDVYDALTNPSQDVRTRILKLTKGTLPNAPSLTNADQKLTALEARFRLEAEGQRTKNIWLAVSTAVGTIFWGFGDLFAKWLMPSS